MVQNFDPINYRPQLSARDRARRQQQLNRSDLTAIQAAQQRRSIDEPIRGDVVDRDVDSGDLIVQTSSGDRLSIRSNSNASPPANVPLTRDRGLNRPVLNEKPYVPDIEGLQYQALALEGRVSRLGGVMTYDGADPLVTPPNPRVRGDRRLNRATNTMDVYDPFDSVWRPVGSGTLVQPVLIDAVEARNYTIHIAEFPMQFQQIRKTAATAADAILIRVSDGSAIVGSGVIEAGEELALTILNADGNEAFFSVVFLMAAI